MYMYSLPKGLQQIRVARSRHTKIGHVIRREQLEHLVTTGIIKERYSRGKQPQKMLDGLTKWLKVGRVTEAQKARGIEVCGVMITYAKELDTRFID